MKLTLGFPTGRYKPELSWLLEDLAWQRARDDEIELLVVDALERPIEELASPELLEKAVTTWRTVPVLPNPWQGKHRIMDREWWALGAAKNAVFVYAAHDYVAIVDDRCHLGPKFLEALRKHERERASAIAGTYTRAHWDDHGTHIRTDTDSRMLYATSQGKARGWIGCDRAWLYGMVFAMPLEFALRVNGHESGCDGVSMEDIIFSCNLTNAGVRIDWDPNLMIAQDRRFHELGPSYIREDKDRSKSPKDKSHALLDRFGHRKRTEFTPDLRELRALALAGQPMPPYDKRLEIDFYDGKPIRDYPIGGG
jgi:hypothetical protein